MMKENRKLKPEIQEIIISGCEGGGAAPGNNKKSCPRHTGAGSLFDVIYEISKIRTRMKIPDIYSFVTMGMIMGLRLVVL